MGEHLYLGLVTARLPPASGKVFQPDRLYSYDVVITAEGEVLGLGERGLLATRTGQRRRGAAARLRRPDAAELRPAPVRTRPSADRVRLVPATRLRRRRRARLDGRAARDQRRRSPGADPPAVPRRRPDLRRRRRLGDDAARRRARHRADRPRRRHRPPIERVKVGQVLRRPEAGRSPIRPTRTRPISPEPEDGDVIVAGDLPAGGKHFPVGQRLDVTQRNAQFTSIDGANHLISFGEFAALHLMVWSPAVLGRADPGRRGGADRRHHPLPAALARLAGGARADLLSRSPTSRSASPSTSTPTRRPWPSGRTGEGRRGPQEKKRAPVARSQPSGAPRLPARAGQGPARAGERADVHDHRRPRHHRRSVPQPDVAAARAGLDPGPGDPDQRHARLRAVPGLGQRPAALRPGDRRGSSRPRRSAARRPAGPRCLACFPRVDAKGRTPRRSPRWRGCSATISTTRPTSTAATAPCTRR